MALPDLTGLNIEDTYQRVLQTDGVNIYDGTGSIVNIAATGPFATTGSNTFNGTQLINGDVTINGTASISVLNVSIESSSIIYSSGSNQFGDALNDTQTLYGTVTIPTGSLTVNGNISASGDLFINNGANQIRIGDNIDDNTFADTFKIYNSGTKGFVSTYFYNSTLELKAGASGSGFVNNWSKIEIADNFASNGYIRLFTSGSERMRISNTGNVGIGTTTPISASLVVNSTGGTSATNIVQFTGASTQRFNFRSDGVMAWGQNVNSAAYGFLNWDTNKSIIGSVGTNNFTFFTNGSERMFISASGNIGIRTNSPAYLLDVSGSARFVDRTYFGNSFSNYLDTLSASDPFWNGALRINGGAWLGASGQKVRVGSYTSVTARFEVVGLGSTSATTAMRVDNSDGQTSLAVLDNGYVGIGTTNISALLHISGAASANLLRIDSPASSSILVVSGSGRIGINTATPRATTELVGTLRITNITDPSRFNDLATDANGYMTLQNLVYGTGIGSNSGWVNLFQNFINVGSGSGYFFTSTANSGTSTRDVGFSRAGINMVAVNDGAAGNANGILLASKISIGRGLAAPVTTLDVSGSGRITNNLSVTGSLDVSGSITINKTNIQSLMIAYSIALG